MYNQLKKRIMKKSILTTGLIASSILYTNSIVANSETNDGLEVFLENNHVNIETIQVYQWIIETEHGIFTGTSISIKDVNEEIHMLTDNTKILKKNIVPITSISDSLESKIYTWTVATNNEYPSGQLTNQEEEKRKIRVFETIEGLKSALTNEKNTLK
jgi:hypothetical protein